MSVLNSETLLGICKNIVLTLERTRGERGEDAVAHELARQVESIIQWQNSQARMIISERISQYYFRYRRQEKQEAMNSGGVDRPDRSSIVIEMSEAARLTLLPFDHPDIDMPDSCPWPLE